MDDDTYKPSSCIILSIKKHRIKMRWRVLKIYAYIGTQREATLFYIML
jgi:hypothetical protein